MDVANCINTLSVGNGIGQISRRLTKDVSENFFHMTRYEYSIDVSAPIVLTECSRRDRKRRLLMIDFDKSAGTL